MSTTPRRAGPWAVVLRPGKTPSGVEVRAHLRRLVRRIRSRWPATRIRFRGDGHYARPEAMTWCEESVDYVFGLPGAKPLSEKTDAAADAVRPERALARLRRNASQGRLLAQRAARHRLHRGDAARSRHPLRRHQSRSRLGRMVVRDPLLRPRTSGKSDQAAQDPTRLGSHVLPISPRQPGAPRSPYRRLLADARGSRRHSKSRDLAKAEFATVRLKLIKIAARIVEMASRVRLAFAAACPNAGLFASLPAALMPSGP